jgi:hypothetical protein
MAFHAAWNVSMLLVMTLGALNFRVFARVCLELLTDLGVAVTADLGKFSSHRHLCLRGMGI